MRRAAVALGLLGAGCEAGAYEAVVPRADDLAVVGPPLSPVDPLAELVLDSLAAVRDEVHPLAGDLERIVSVIEGHRPDGRDGAAERYGPFADPDHEGVQWHVAVTEGAKTTRFELVVGEPPAAELAVAIGGITLDDGVRRAGWTLWPGRRQAVYERDPDIPASRRVEAELTVDPEGNRVLSLLGEGDDPVGRILGAGVRVAVDADGGGELSLLAVNTVPVELLAGAPVPIGDGVPAIGAAWTEGGAAVIGVLLHTASGDALLSACYDPDGALSYRAVFPETLGADDVALGSVDACALPIAVTVPVPP